MTTVVTYQLAYAQGEVTLRAECVDRDDHDQSVLGPVLHGARRGRCDGRWHGRRPDPHPLIAQLERAMIRHSAPDARRVLQGEMDALRVAAGQGTGGSIRRPMSAADLLARMEEARRVLTEWERVS